MMRFVVPILVLLAVLVPLEEADAQLRRRRDRAILGRSSGQRGAQDRLTLQHGGRTRSYTLHVPERVRQENAPVPLVIMLHGGGGNADNAESMSGFSPKADREGFIVAYPDGTGGGRAPMFTWNAGHCCGYAMQNKVDDVGFIGALIDQVQRDHRIDPDRIYVTGMSNGGMMSHRVGIGLADRVAAIAPVVGAVFGDEASPRAPVSAIIINGMRDESVPYDGGKSGGLARVRGTERRPGRRWSRGASGRLPAGAIRRRANRTVVVTRSGSTTVRHRWGWRATPSRRVGTPGPAGAAVRGAGTIPATRSTRRT
ncbi:MAG: prolyl oligopeptidase family serine peptidase [Gemmatimonadetes bacterium]|nr:prolyl oligopeptidase family serine peptidase [Gemmatimonadota bacterium]